MMDLILSYGAFEPNAQHLNCCAEVLSPGKLAACMTQLAAKGLELQSLRLPFLLLLGTGYFFSLPVLSPAFLVGGLHGTSYLSGVCFLN